MKQHSLNPKDFIIDEIESIELIGELDTVDITVDDTHMFYANDVYSHNSGVQKTIIQNDDIAEAFGKVMVSDIILTMSRKLEDKINDTGYMHLSKNRHGADGITFNLKTNLNIGEVHIGREDEKVVKQFLQRQQAAQSGEFLKTKFSEFKSKKDNLFHQNTAENFG